MSDSVINLKDIDRRSLNRTDKVPPPKIQEEGQEPILKPPFDFYESTLESMKVEEEELVIEEAQIPQESPTLLFKTFEFFKWLGGFVYTFEVAEAAPVLPIQDIKTANKTKEGKPQLVIRQLAPRPKLEAPQEFDKAQLAATMAEVNQLIHRIDEINREGHEDTVKFDPNKKRKQASRAASAGQGKKELAASKTGGGDEDDLESQFLQDMQEAALHTEFVKLLLSQKDLSQESLKLLSESISIFVKINKSLEKVFFDLKDQGIKRKRMIKLTKLFSGILEGCLIAGTVAGIAVTAASAGTMAVVVISTLTAAGSVTKGSVTILQGVLEHKNRKLMAELYGISLDRHNNNKRMEVIFVAFRNSLEQVRNSWELIVKLLQKRRRIAKIDA